MNLSDSFTMPTIGEDQITISSASRDRCTAVIDAAAERLQGEVAIGDGIERIRRGPVEAERLRGGVAIEIERRAGDRARAERALIEPLARIGEPAAVPRRHFDIGEQVMAEGDRLGRLHMGEAGHHRVGVRLRLLGERVLKVPQCGFQIVDGVAYPQPEVGGDLVVAGARGMQPPGRRTDQLGEPAFHVHVDVFERAFESKRALLDL